MKGVIITKPGLAVVKEMDIPGMKEDEVMIRVAVSGLCGSDLHIFKGIHKLRIPPVIPGHEVAGEVIAIGKEVTKIKAGDRVTVEPNNYCGHCPVCLAGNYNLCPNKVLPGIGRWEGTFVQYFTAPEKCIYILKSETTWEQAVLAEPLAVAVRAVKRAGQGKRMMILGSGTIGLLTLKVALLSGYSEVFCTDTMTFNRKTALAMGAAAAWDPLADDIIAKVKAVTGGYGMDAVIITASAPGILEQALSIAAINSNVVLVAVLEEPEKINMNYFNAKEIHYTGTNTYTPDDFMEALKYIESGIDLSTIITHCFPLDKVQYAFELYEKKLEDVIKVLIYPNQ